MFIRARRVYLTTYLVENLRDVDYRNLKSTYSTVSVIENVPNWDVFEKTLIRIDFN